MQTEIPLKQWRYEQAARLHITETALRTRLYGHHTHPYPPVRRVNKRVVFVLVEQLQP